MASKFGEHLAKAAQGLSLKAAARDIDVELQEVREVLEGLAIRRHIDHVTLCWCKKRWDATKPHEEKCQRARDLMEKLVVKDGAGNG